MNDSWGLQQPAPDCWMQLAGTRIQRTHPGKAKKVDPWGDTATNNRLLDAADWHQNPEIPSKEG